MYFSHNSNIKYIDSTMKCIGFESFHYTINLYIVYVRSFKTKVSKSRIDCISVCITLYKNVSFIYY